MKREHTERCALALSRRCSRLTYGSLGSVLDVNADGVCTACERARITTLATLAIMRIASQREAPPWRSRR